MRSSRIVVVGSLVVFSALAWAQRETRTQAEQDGMVGPVKSVSTIAETSDVDWQQPNGPTLLFPIVCHDCEYSPEGYRTKFGQVVDGKFNGEVIALHRDGNGRIVEAVSTGGVDGGVHRRTVLGPAGPTEEMFFGNDNKVTSHTTLRYDEAGHISETVARDASGAQLDRVQTVWNKDEWTQRIVWGKNDLVLTRETYDPAIDEQHYTAFDETGNVRLAWTYANGKVTSFWEPSNAASQSGDTFSDFNDKSNPKAFHCTSNGVCEKSLVHYTYADAANRNPASAEWRDANGNMLYAVYYTYAFDAEGNWTHRDVSVWNPQLGARTAYETDDRLITYWK